MTTPQNPLNQLDDFLAELEDKLEHGGAWCHKAGDKGLVEHYYISRNPKSQLAITLCQRVVPKTALSLTTPAQKCMACFLFEQAQKEAQQTLMQMQLNMIEQTQTQDPE